MCDTKYISNIVVSSQSYFKRNPYAEKDGTRSVISSTNLLRVFMKRSDGEIFEHELYLDSEKDANSIKDLLESLEKQRRGLNLINNLRLNR